MAKNTDIGTEPQQRRASSSSDAELVLRTRSGDRNAFAELWNRHYPAALSVARTVTRSFDAEDLVQEAFARVFQAIQKGGGPSASFRAYLFTSVRNTAMGWGRGQRESATDELDALIDPASTDQAAEHALDQSLSAQAFRSLPSRWQEVLWYSEVEQMKPAEIAPLLGMTAGATSQLAFRAREGLREAWIQAHLRSAEPGSECEWAIGQMGAYERNNLGRRDRRKLDEHLSTCARCLIVAAEAKEVSERMPLVLLPLVLGATASGAYLALVQTGTASAATLAAMPAAVTGGSLGAAATAAGSGVTAAGVSGGGVAAAQAPAAFAVAGATGQASGTAGSAGAVGAAGGTGAAGGAAAGGASVAGVIGLVGAGATALVIAGAVVATAALTSTVAETEAQPETVATDDTSDSDAVIPPSAVAAPSTPVTPSVPPVPPQSAPSPSPEPAPEESAEEPETPAVPVASTSGASPAVPVIPPVAKPTTVPKPVEPRPVEPLPVALSLGDFSVDCNAPSGRRITIIAALTGQPGATVQGTLGAASAPTPAPTSTSTPTSTVDDTAATKPELPGTGAEETVTAVLNSSGAATLQFHPNPSRLMKGAVLTFSYAKGIPLGGSIVKQLLPTDAVHWWASCVEGGTGGTDPGTTPSPTPDPSSTPSPAPSPTPSPEPTDAPEPTSPAPTPSEEPTMPTDAPTATDHAGQGDTTTDPQPAPTPDPAPETDPSAVLLPPRDPADESTSVMTLTL